MMPEDKHLTLKLTDYQQEGLYLIFSDSTFLELTKEKIERKTEEFWKNPEKISPEVKNAVEFQRCYFCPLKGEATLCDALKPILPFLEIVDRYASYDRVIAIYKGKEKELYHLTDSDMQEALKYISILSLFRYCQIGKKYWKYYFGIVPLEGAHEAATRMFLNIYFLHKGQKEIIDKIIMKFKEEITISTRNQVQRLNLICKNDAFQNAFIASHIITEIMSLNIEKRVSEAFERFEKLK